MYHCSGGSKCLRFPLAVDTPLLLPSTCFGLFLISPVFGWPCLISKFRSVTPISVSVWRVFLVFPLNVGKTHHGGKPAVISPWIPHDFLTAFAHPRYGYVNVTDMKAMGKLAEFLTLEPDVVSKEMKVASSEETEKKICGKTASFTPKWFQYQKTDLK